MKKYERLLSPRITYSTLEIRSFRENDKIIDDFYVLIPHYNFIGNKKTNGRELSDNILYFIAICYYL